MDVADWLRNLGLERYAPAFADNDIDAAILPRLTAEDLVGIGVTSVGHRRKLLEAVAALNAAPIEAPAPPPTAETAPEPSAAERRQLTVLLADLVGSTALSRRVDPETMGNVLRDFQNTVAGEITRFEGHVAKFMGDGVLAYFGWPAAHEDDAERAVRAGLALGRAVARMDIGNEPASARVGIATGQVVVGQLIGEGIAAEHAVAGETPNLAARLQTLAPPGGVVIADGTRRLLGGLFELGEVGPKALKGFDEPVCCFLVRGTAAADSRFEAMHTAGVTPLVGREQELALLLDRWELAKGGDGQVVLLSGEPGIGKSRILLALRERVREESQIRLRYSCSPYHGNSALYPIIEQLQRACGFQRDDSDAVRLSKLEARLREAVSDVSEATPLIAELLSIAITGTHPPLALSPQQKRFRTFEALLAQLEGLAARQPVLQILEDAHWLDPTSLELFGLVVDRVQHLPVLLVITFRPEFAAPWTGYPHATALTLNRLPRSHALTLIERVTSQRSLPGEVAQLIMAKTDGVPLFVEELTKAVIESGLLRDAGDRFELTGPLPPLAIPATLHDSLMSRLGRLAPVKEVAQIGAVIGREFSHDLLVAVAGMEPGRLDEAVGELIRAELVFRRGTPPHHGYSFKHALVQDAAYASLLKGRRQQLHQRIAATLEQSAPEVVEAQPEVIARHLGEAGLTEPAVGYWLRAGQRATVRSAMIEAVAHLTAGLELIRHAPDADQLLEQKLDLHVALGSALIAAKGFAAPETGAAYLEARRLAEELGAIERWFAVTYGLCLYHLYRAEIPEARRSAAALVRRARGDGQRDRMFFALRAAGVSAFPAGRFLAGRWLLERALELRDRTSVKGLPFVYAFDPVVVCLDYLARSLFPIGFPEQALRRSDEALSLARTGGHRSTLALPLFFGAVLRQWCGDIAVVRALADELVEMAAQERFRFWLAGGTIMQGWVKVTDGRIDAGIGQISDGLRAWRDAGGEYFVPYFLSLLAEAHRLAGRPLDGLRMIDEALARMASSGERWFEAELYRLRGEFLGALSPPHVLESKASFEQALTVARAQGACIWGLRAACSLGRWLSARGQRTMAQRIVEAARGTLDVGPDLADFRDADRLLRELA
jgi:class 3 adenylate cyclase/predicted ATPase